MSTKSAAEVIEAIDAELKNGKAPKAEGKPAKGKKGKAESNDDFVARMIEENGMRQHSTRATTDSAYGYDALGAKIGKGTHYVHAVLCEVSLTSPDATISVKDCEAACNARWPGHARKSSAVHFNTLVNQGYAIAVTRGQYRLTDNALRLIDVTRSKAGADDLLAHAKAAKKIKATK